MKDPDEGLTADGMIKTGVKRNRVPLIFEPIVQETIQKIKAIQNRLSLNNVSLYLYGSVATGMAVSPQSDVDFLTIGIDQNFAKDIAHDLSAQFSSICRGAEIAPVHYDHVHAESEEAYGLHVFLRHYCIYLYGQDVVDLKRSFPGDAKAARGFNGDIKNHYNQWCSEKSQINSEMLGRRIARKTLLAVAGLVSVHDHIWTTDRKYGASRWGQINLQHQKSLEKLAAWSEGTKIASISEINEVLCHKGTIHSVAEDFQNNIGLWPQFDKDNL